VALATVMLDGQPQSNIVWCDHDGVYARVHTTRERQKGRNMQAFPKVALLVIDPKNDGRWIEIRGEVEITEEDALEQLDEITRQYTDRPQYYGFIFPEEQRERETRIICTIKPTRVNMDAIYS